MPVWAKKEANDYFCYDELIVYDAPVWDEKRPYPDESLRGFLVYVFCQCGMKSSTGICL